MSRRYLFDHIVLSSMLAVAGMTACGAPRTLMPAAAPSSSTAVAVVMAPRQAEVTPQSVAPDVADERVPTDLATPAAQQAAERARAVLAQHLGISAEQIEILSSRQYYRGARDGENGGKLDGWLVNLMAQDRRYQYHVNATGAVQLLP